MLDLDVGGVDIGSPSDAILASDVTFAPESFIGALQADPEDTTAPSNRCPANRSRTTC